MTAQFGSERGAASTEFAVVMAVVLLSFFALTVYGGRVVQAENDVQSAAHEAARAASLAGSPGEAAEAARQVAASNLSRSGVACGSGAAVAVDLTQFGPGGQVTVNISCTAGFGDAGSLGVPNTQTFSASATEVIDTYRGG